MSKSPYIRYDKSAGLLDTTSQGGLSLLVQVPTTRREMTDTRLIGVNTSLGVVVRSLWRPSLMCGGRNTGVTSSGSQRDNQRPHSSRTG